MVEGTIQIKEKTLNYKYQYKSEKLLLIKTGWDGSLSGYMGKNDTIANTFIEADFSALICDNNSKIDEKDSFAYTMHLADELMKSHTQQYEIYYFALSRGASQLMSFGYKYPIIKKAIVVNPPLFINWHKQSDGLKLVTHTQIKVIVGDKDPSFKFLGLVDICGNPLVSAEGYQGADHNFSGLLQEFIDLPNEFLMQT